MLMTVPREPLAFEIIAGQHGPLKSPTRRMGREVLQRELLGVLVYEVPIK
jgi:hypothetical protein